MKRTLLFDVFLCFLLWKHGDCGSNLDQLPHTEMIKEGDLNIGAIIHFFGYSLNPVCAKHTPHAVLHQLIHSVDYEVDRINKIEDILPNITLGYVIVDDCTRVIPTVPRALQFMPLVKNEYKNSEVLAFGKNHEVVGIIGPYNSEPTLVVATMASFFEIPVLGPYASSDALSDKTKFPYFFRTISPDRQLIKVLVQFSKDMGWEYISLIYSEDEFGYNANSFLRKYTQELGLCVEESYPVDMFYKRFNYDDLLAKISAPSVRSKVFFIYLINSQVDGLINAIVKRQEPLDIIFIFSQCVELHSFRRLFSHMHGFIRVAAQSRDTRDFNQHYKYSVNPWSRPDDPWISTLWEQYYGCKFVAKPGDVLCDNFTNIFDFPFAPMQVRNIPGQQRLPMADAVEILALALDRLIKLECPEAIGNKTLLRACAQGHLVRKYLSEVEVIRNGSKIFNFNENFDGILKYDFFQIQRDSRFRYSSKVIGQYSPLDVNYSIKILKDELQWPSSSKLSEGGALESVCSYACKVGEIYMQGDVECCWTCHRCRDNEITSNNQTFCLPCPLLQWPDPDDLLSCQQIEPSYLSWTHIYGLGMTLLASVGMICTVTTTIFLIKNKDTAIIKGSSRELIAVILTGAFLAYLSIPAFIIKPTYASCVVSRAGFSISCTLLFAPLFVKSLRVFRIFKASEDFQHKARCVSITSQMIFVAILIMIQISMTVVTGFIWQPYAEFSMPVKTEKYVELQCDFNIYGITVPLSFNILLALLCAVCGFITKNLPDNFNESWYIFVSISTTLFIWVAFLPTYFAAFYAYHKAVLLALALFLNSTITVICLFCPKIYAVYFSDENKLILSKFKGKGGQSVADTEYTTTKG